MDSHERFEELLDHDSHVETRAMNTDWSPEPRATEFSLREAQQGIPTGENPACTTISVRA
jgi:hypothetical protein